VTFVAQGYFWGNVNRIPDSTLGAIPTGEPLLDALADGNLLKGTGSAVYVMEGGRKHHVTSLDAFRNCGYGWDAVFVISNSLLNSVPTGDPLSGPPCPHLSPPSGSLVKGSDAPVYVMQGGLKRHVPNLATFAVQGFLWGNVNQIPDSSLNAIPTGDPLLSTLADGNLLKGTGSAVYVMEGGRKHHVTSLDAFRNCGYGWDAVFVISNSLLNSVPTGNPLSGPPCPHLSPPSGSLVKGSDAPVYVMQGGLKRHVPNLVTFEAGGYLWGNVNRVADSALSAIPTGDPLLNALAEGNLLKGSGAAVYVMEGGVKRHVSSLAVLADCGYGWDAVKVISDTHLEGIPSGASLSGPPCPQLSPPDGTLLQGSSGSIYVMLDGSKLLIASQAAFSDCGYAAGNINTIPDSMLDSIPDGLILTGQPCP
jgi:hypothetical protein